jgi:peptidyl-prolyl cis-trans isomerase D
MALTELSLLEANEFLKKLFNANKKRGIITLEDGKVILYDILEQKILNISDELKEDTIKQLKNLMFNEGLIKILQSKYKTDIFIEGL